MTIRNAYGAAVAVAIAAAVALPAAAGATAPKPWWEPTYRSCKGDDGSGVTRTYPHGTRRGMWVCKDGVWEKDFIYAVMTRPYPG